MKVQPGAQYICKSGHITGRLKLNPKKAINFPFIDETTGREYSDDGKCFSGEEIDTLIAKHYVAVENRLICDGDCPTIKIVEIETVTISKADYDRFLEMEKTLRWIVEENKKLGL